MPQNHIPISPSILYFGTPVVSVVTSNEDGSAKYHADLIGMGVGNQEV